MSTACTPAVLVMMIGPTETGDRRKEMSEIGYVTTANARIEYHRNGVGGEGYYTIALSLIHI